MTNVSVIKEAIILAGGLGTRLQSVVADVPKSLAPVDGKPFLGYVLDYAIQQGIKKFIFALGYKTEQIETFVKDYLPAGSYIFSVEEEPLGTGGAIYKACHLVSRTDVIVLNADTFFAVDFALLSEFHEQQRSEVTLALKPMTRFDRYGVVKIDDHHIVTGFNEKRYQEEGLINGGVYALNAKRFLLQSFPSVFSFEKDYLEKRLINKSISGLISDAYFIDIGIPEDYSRAQTELITQVVNHQPSSVTQHPTIDRQPSIINPSFNLSQIDNNWTLFLDRDGVINYENAGTYVRNWEEFIFYPQTPENIAYFNTRFKRVIVATNQRGITRGIMRLADLEDIHASMIREIEEKGGRIDHIYFCVDMESQSPCRKPNTGMAIQAVQDFPEIDLSKSIMVGNNLSDMRFGKNAGMKTVFLATTSPDLALPHEVIDLHFDDLPAFVKALKES